MPENATEITLETADGVNLLPLLQGLESVKITDAANAGMDATAWQALRYLPKLRTVYITAAEFSDLGLISDLLGLKVLWINKTQVRDLTPLVKLQGLETFFAKSGTLSDLSALAALSKLRVVEVENNPNITSIAALRGASALEVLDISRTGVTDISALHGKSELKELDLRGILDPNLSPLLDLPKLKTFRDPDGTKYETPDALAAFFAQLKSAP